MMSRGSPGTSLGELLRREPSVNVPGLHRPRSPTLDRKISAAARNEDWMAISTAVTTLFHRKKLENLELHSLTEKVKTVKSDIGPDMICILFKESILMKGMIILREDVKEKFGETLLYKLADVWKHFFCEVLPLLQAVFCQLTPPDGQSLRDIALMSFRDIVLLKTKLQEAFAGDTAVQVPPRIIQMLLILQSVHDNSPIARNYLKVETLLSYVVSPYLSSTGIRTKPATKLRTEPLTEKEEDISMLPKGMPQGSPPTSPRTTERLDPVFEVDYEPRRTFGLSFDESVPASVFSDSEMGSIKLASISDL